MPLFVMDNISFARLPRVNAEDVSYIAIASRLAETNVKLDMMNTLISENASRNLQNEERVQYLARNTVTMHILHNNPTIAALHLGLHHAIIKQHMTSHINLVNQLHPVKLVE